MQIIHTNNKEFLGFLKSVSSVKHRNLSTEGKKKNKRQLEQCPYCVSKVYKLNSHIRRVHPDSIIGKKLLRKQLLKKMKREAIEVKRLNKKRDWLTNLLLTKYSDSKFVSLNELQQHYSNSKIAKNKNMALLTKEDIEYSVQFIQLNLGVTYSIEIE